MSSYPRTTRRTWSLSRQTELFTTQSHGPQKSPGLKADQAHRPSALSTVSEGSQTESFFTDFDSHSIASRGQSPAARRTLTSNSYMQTDHLTLTSGHGVFVYFVTQAEAGTQTNLISAPTSRDGSSTMPPAPRSRDGSPSRILRESSSSSAPGGEMQVTNSWRSSRSHNSFYGKHQMASAEKDPPRRRKSHMTDSTGIPELFSFKPVSD